MTKKDGGTTRPSEPDQVAAYLARLKHPLADLVGALRKIILKTDPEIGEEIKWNAPAFFYTGEMSPFDPKEYKRHLVVFNLFQKDCVRLVFWRGARVDDQTGFLEGDYPDGRRLARFFGMDEVKSRQRILRQVLRKQLKALDR
jgi:hypothetical protein